MNFTFDRDASKHVHFEAAKYEALVGQERAAFEATRRDLEQYRTKVEGLSHDVRGSISSSGDVLASSFV